jgi:KDO2-lipid IV(A) lauroyltransferase
MLHELGIAVGRVIYPFLRSRERVAIRNLRNAFPDRSPEELKQIAARSFETISAAFVEMLAFPTFSEADIRALVHVENPEIFDMLATRERGVVYLTAHYGSWELAAQSIRVYSQRPLAVIAKTQSNHLVDRLITKWRSRFGCRVVLMHAVRDVLKILHEKGGILLAADQAASKESLVVEFFGRMVPTYGGPAVFALKTGAILMLSLCVAQVDGTYRMRLQEVPMDDLTEYSEANVLELTRRHVRMTEQAIIDHPEQWMWMHKRWKHVPDRPEVAGIV